MGILKYPICMEIAGPTAMWARPDTGDSPISYPAPTSSAVRGIFESILWGPNILISPTKVEICSPVIYHTYVTNYGGPLRSSKSIKNGTNYQFFATVLIDVCYRLYAEVKINPNKSYFSEKNIDWDRKTTSPGHAYQEIFNRRLQRGQCYSIPVLGWREFVPSYFGPFRRETLVYTNLQDIVIPSMLREVFSGGYHTDFNPIYDNNIVIHKGTLLYPERQALI